MEEVFDQGPEWLGHLLEDAVVVEQGLSTPSTLLCWLMRLCAHHTGVRTVIARGEDSLLQVSLFVRILYPGLTVSSSPPSKYIHSLFLNVCFCILEWQSDRGKDRGGKEGKEERGKERRESLATCWFTPPIRSAVKARSQELFGLLHGWQGSKCMSHHLLPRDALAEAWIGSRVIGT